jgi:hypothetical protein
MFIIMQRLPVFDNRDAVIATRIMQASENTYETPGLANYFANQFADECWCEIDFFVASTAAPTKPVAMPHPQGLPADQDIEF